MIVVIDKTPYTVLEIIKYITEQDSRTEYLCDNGKYKRVIREKEFMRGETFL